MTVQLSMNVITPTGLLYKHKRTCDEYQDYIGIAYDSEYKRKVSGNLHRNHRKTKSLDNVLTFVSYLPTNSRTLL